MADLKQDIAAYDAMREDLELAHLGKWVVLRDCQLVDVFETFESAARAAVRRFGRGPYLIRQVGASAVSMSAAVLYHPAHA